MLRNISSFLLQFDIKTRKTISHIGFTDKKLINEELTFLFNEF